VEPRRLVRRRERLVVEERRQLVVALGESRLPVELPLEPERVAAQRLEELRGEARPCAALIAR
jgi:hypothetical protein